MILIMQGKGVQMMAMGAGWWWIIGLVILIVVILLSVRTDRKKAKVDETGQKSVLQMLKERYARGEITEEEYDSQKQKLQGNSSLNDQTRVKNTLTSKENPDDFLAESEKPRKDK